MLCTHLLPWRPCHSPGPGHRGALTDLPGPCLFQLRSLPAHSPCIHVSFQKTDWIVSLPLWGPWGASLCRPRKGAPRAGQEAFLGRPASRSGPPCHAPLAHASRLAGPFEDLYVNSSLPPSATHSSALALPRHGSPACVHSSRMFSRAWHVLGA